MVNIGEITVNRKKPAPDAILISDEEEGESGTGHATTSNSRESAPSPCQNPAASCTKKPAASGRKAESSIWDFSCFDEQLNKSFCLEEYCGFSISARNTGNAVAHLRTKNHAHLWERFSAREAARVKEKEQKKPKPSLVQPTVLEAAKNPFMPIDKRYKEIIAAVALCVASSGMALNVVRQPDFHNLMRTLNPRTPLPGYTAVASQIKIIHSKLANAMTEKLFNARRVSFTTDVWTKRGMTASFLGLTDRFSPKDVKQPTQKIAVACRQFPSPHTAEAVYSLVQTTMTEFAIPRERVSAFVINNGSNMVCAFKNYVESPKNLFDYFNHEDALKQLESEIGEAFMADGYEAIDEDDHEIIRELAEFEQFERPMDLLFTNYKRHACLIHLLQCTVRIVEKPSALQPVLNKARKLVTTFNMSAAATEELLKQGGIKLVSDVKTRWNPTLLMLKRLIKLKKPVDLIVISKEMKGGLTVDEWKILSAVTHLLDIFDQVTRSWSGDDESTLHKVCPQLKRIFHHLRDLKDPAKKLDLEKESDAVTLSALLNQMAWDMEEDLQTRFGYIIDNRHPNYDPIYIAAVLLHPSLRQGLSASDLIDGRKGLLHYHSLWNKPRKSSSQFGSFIAAIPETAPTDRSIPVLKSALDFEIDLYMANSIFADDFGYDDDPANFWRGNVGFFPLLSPLALDILAIPASSAPSERLFSTAGFDTAGRRNRLTGLNLERHVLIQKNRSLLNGVSLI
ncbi:hypothetical protein BV898_02155 [Hypsibius exemplaris]|uniref:HAT C-terminal dimerisation domain-containing protein n=1 Tax=Hypsibius exemplaris TaxID=2072580 RepID=A0A1W0X9X6_HYPEX|nr:hypothetical protein BV898_02155 [Hypsibius exemplaris]